MSRAAVPLFLVLLLGLAPSASAVPSMTFGIFSTDFDINSPVWANITGPPGMAISIRVTEASGNIIAGRDTVLDLTGNYSFEWRASQEGAYNVTVTWATGFTMTKPVRIHDMVTSRDISDLYQAIFNMESRLKDALADNKRLAEIAVGVAAVSALATIIAALYVRNAAPRPKTELERFIVEDLRGEVERKLRKKEK